MKPSSFCVRTALALIVCLSGSHEATGQQRGHFLLGAGTSYVFGTEGSPSNLMYSLGAGLTYDLRERVRLTGALGGFRSAVSFPGTGPRRESVSGPLLYAGAEYLLGMPTGKCVPVVSLGLGCRLAIPMKTGEPLYDRAAPEGVKDSRYIPLVDTDGVQSRVSSQGSADGVFLKAAVGTDIRLGGVSLNVSLTGELTEYFSGAFAKGTAERFGRAGTLTDGTPVFMAGRAPFGERLRGAAGIAVTVRL